MQNINIKPLVWVSDIQTGSWVAETIVGQFVVHKGVWYLGTRFHSPEFRDDETAKASAQAHFEAVIRSTLE